MLVLNNNLIPFCDAVAQIYPMCRSYKVLAVTLELQE